MQVNKDQIPVSDRLDDVVKRKLEILSREQKMRRMCRVTIGMGAAAACFMGVLAVGVANPAWASQLPIIGHIFEQMGENLNYPGDYGQKGSPLGTEGSGELDTEADTEAETTAYTKTVDGMTVTLSEVYSNGQALNIALVLQSQEPFPDTKMGQDGKPLIRCLTNETYSFNSETQTDYVTLDGEFTDEYTFAGVMRFDLNTKVAENTALAEGQESADTLGEEETDGAQIPKNFTMTLNIDQIIGSLANPEVRDMGVTQEEMEAMSDEEWRRYRAKLDEEDPSWNQFPNVHEYYWFDGPWEFELEVTQNMEDCVTVEVGTNEEGIGFEKIVKTPYEITMYPVDPRSQEEIAEDNFYYYLPVMLDADGMLMDSGGGGFMNTVAVGDHDVSQVEVYLFEDAKWLDEVKGYWWNNVETLQNGGTLEDGRTFKELCDETCVFHETVTIPAR